MQKIFTRLVLCLLMGVASATAGEDQPMAEKNTLFSPEDEKVMVVMEILQLMDLAEELDMVKDMEFLIEDDQDVQTTD